MQLDPVNAGGLRRECTHLPRESGGPRKRTRRLVRLRSIATSIGSTLVCGRRSTSISATSPGFPLSGNQHTFVSKPRRPARSFTFSTAAPIATKLMMRRCSGRTSKSDRPTTAPAYRHVRAGLRAGCPRMAPAPPPRRATGIQQDPDPSYLAPAAGTHCRGRVVAPTNSAEAICLSHVRSNSGALAVSEYTILGAAPN